MNEGKTSIFIVEHDRCDPANWRPKDVLALARFISFGGSITYAAALARLGMKVVRSDFYKHNGGDMAHVGWSRTEWQRDAGGKYVEIVEDLDLDDEMTPIVPVYAGPLQYAVRIPIGNDDGEVEGYEIEIKETEVEAKALVEAYYGAPVTES